MGLIRQDEEGPALSESAAGVLEGGEEENRKKKQNIKNPVEEKNGGSGVASVSPAAPRQGCCED